jgi:mannose-6-phosphate isomerase-like protein (cupin superfamily)
MSSHPAKSAQRRPKVVQAGEGMRLNVQGIVFSYKAVGEDTGGHYALTEGMVPPHHGAPEHIHHREDEAFYILEGEFKIECGGEVFKATPGTFALLPKGLLSLTVSRTCQTNRARSYACIRPVESRNSLST